MNDGPGALRSSRDLLHHLRKSLIHWTAWDQAATALAELLRAEQAARGLLGRAGDAPAGPAAELLREAHAGLGRALDPGRCDEIAAYFRQARGFAGHHLVSSDGVERDFDAIVADGQRYVSYRPETVMAAPHLMALANRPEFVDAIGAAMGCLPVLYSVNAWWSFPVPGEPWPPHSQHFHRDNDDFRFFTLFVYLTDVDGEGDGPNQIVARTNSAAGAQAVMDECRILNEDVRRTLMNPYPQPPDLVPRFLAPAIRSTFGPRGTAFLADTRALHRGLAPRDRARLIFWARFGLGPNTNSSDTDLRDGPVRAADLGSALADTPKNRYVNRLLVRWD
jgi:hypothetical protein